LTQASQNLDTVDRIGENGQVLFNRGENDQSLLHSIEEKEHTKVDEQKTAGADYEIYRDGQDSELIVMQQRERLAASVESDERATGPGTLKDYNKSIENHQTYDGITVDDQIRNRT
jgi:hypothetical protein